MERICTDELKAHVGERVLLKGWALRIRVLGGVAFLMVRDARSIAQIVFRDAGGLAMLNDLLLESAVEVEGLVIETTQTTDGVEIVDPLLSVVSLAVEPPPFDLFRPELEASLPTALDHAGLALRHASRRAALRVASASANGFRSGLREQGFTEIFTPKIVSSSTESGAEVFRLDYYGRPAFLAQSPQFYKQMMVDVFERVFEVGSVFRAEPHNTGRHLSEYVSLDAEMGFIDGPETVMSCLRDVAESMVNSVRIAMEELGIDLRRALPRVPDEVPIVHFSGAQTLLSEAIGEDLSGEPDLAPDHERWLCEWAEREFGSEFLFVLGYPLVKRPFYTHPDPDRPGSSLGFDLLFRGVEIATGGQRLHHYSDYLDALSDRGEVPEGLEGYLEVFRHGMPPHGGFALGLERWTAKLTGASNVREVTAFPRDAGRLVP